MKFSTILYLGLGLASGSTGYVITVFEGNNCSGESKRINVWDNTCSTPRFSASRSIRVEKYGGDGQRVRIYQGNNCFSGVVRGPWDAAQSDHSWWTGNCIDFGSDSAKAYGSSALL